MFDARDVAEDVQTDALHAVVTRCLRACAGSDHQYANALRRRSQGERSLHHSPRTRHLSAISARAEARVCDLQQEVR